MGDNMTKRNKKPNKSKKEKKYEYEEEEPVWTTIHEEVQCGLVHNVKVYITPLVMGKINYIMKKMGNTEWLAYLKTHVDDGVVVLDDLMIPKQHVSGADVRVEDGIGAPDGYGAVIHSHHYMYSTSFSGTDDTYINANNDISILVRYKKDGSLLFEGEARVKTECGRYSRVEIDFITIPIEDVEVDLSNIHKETYSYDKKWYKKSIGNYYGYGEYYNRDLLDFYGFEEEDDDVAPISDNRDVCPICNAVVFDLDAHLEFLHKSREKTVENGEKVGMITIKDDEFDVIYKKYKYYCVDKDGKVVYESLTEPAELDTIVDDDEEDDDDDYERGYY